MDPIAAAWKRALLETMRSRDQVHLPNFLSGGVDSATLLAAQLELGAHPVCYSFTVGGRVHDDPKVARRMCRDFGLEHVIVDIPRNQERLVADIREVIRLRRTAKKASIQCAQPIMHMARRAAADGHTRALIGTGAVCLDDKRVAILWAQQGEEVARAYRASKLNDRHTDCGTGHMHGIARQLGVTLEEPYSDEPLRSHALALDYAELNRGPDGRRLQKGIAVRAFPEFWGRKGYYRRNSPLQVNSGVREWHDTLLADPQFNTRGLRSIVGVYNDMAKGRV